MEAHRHLRNTTKEVKDVTKAKILTVFSNKMNVFIKLGGWGKILKSSLSKWSNDDANILSCILSRTDFVASFPDLFQICW